MSEPPSGPFSDAPPDLVYQLFQEAMDLESHLRVDYVKSSREATDAQKKEVLGLLIADKAADSIFQASPVDLLLEAETPESTALPKTFGKYVLRELLGEGGMGTVYFATREDLSQQVALKIVKGGVFSPQRRKRFQREKESLARLQHPNIAQLFDADSPADDTPWFAMEYVEGAQSILEYAKGRSTSEILVLIESLCEALSHAHSRLVIHCDLKPSNLLVNQHGRLKIVDFGIARVLEPDEESSSIASTIQAMTPAYAAPEQLEAKSIGTFTDIYAVGVLLYELLSGQHPFARPEQSRPELEQRILEGRCLPVSKILEKNGRSLQGVRSKDLDLVLSAAIAPDSRSRYQSAQALRLDLQRLRRAQPVEIQAPSFLDRLICFVRRNLWRCLAAAVLLVLIFAAAATYNRNINRANRAAQDEAIAKEKVLQFVLRMLDGGESVSGPSKDLRVIDMVSYGAKEALAFEGRPAIQARIWQSLGKIQSALGAFEQANAALDRAEKSYRAHCSPACPELAETLRLRAELKIKEGDLSRARELAQASLELNQSMEDAPPAQKWQAQLTLGLVHETVGDYDKALESARRVFTALKVNKKLPRLRLESLRVIADNLWYLGKTKEAEPRYREVLALSEELYGEGHPMVGEAHYNLGNIFDRQSLEMQAENAYRRAYETHLAWYGEEHHFTGMALRQVATALAYQKKTEESMRLLKKSIEILRKTLGPDDRQVASALLMLARLHNKQENFDLAQRYFEQTLEIYQQVYNGSHAFIGIVLPQLAEVRAAQGDFEHSLALHQEAIEMLLNHLPAYHDYTAGARVRLARTLIKMNEPENALEQLEEAMSILEKLERTSYAWYGVAYENYLQVQEMLDAAGRR